MVKPSWKAFQHQRTANESEQRKDIVTGRTIRRLSTQGRINQTPTYHTNSGFSADGRYLVFVSIRDGCTYVLRAEVESGELCVVWQAKGIGDRNYIHRGMGLTGPDVDGRGISGNRLCIAPKSQYAVFTCERSLYAVDLHTFEARTLIEDIGREWIFGAPCVSPNEEYVAITVSSAHLDLGEKKFPQARFYGHLTPDAKRPALILDGDFTKDKLQWLYYDRQEPRLEEICRHNTEWGSLPGQYSHPHPLTEASGRWVSYTAAKNGRSDVYVVETGYRISDFGAQ